MQFMPVVSSNIHEIGYDNATKTLVVSFHNGSTYEYIEVPPQLVNDFIVASSKGRFLNDKIKGNFKYRKIA